MKQKYTLVVADSEINVITDEPKEAIDTIVGVVDRRIREIHLHSRSCSKTEAALLLCLDYCAEKLKLQKKIRVSNTEIERLGALNDSLAKENEILTREIETLRQTLNIASTRTSAKPQPTAQLNFDDMNEQAEEVIEMLTDVEPEAQEIVPEAEVVEVAEENPPKQEQEEKVHVKVSRKKRLRSMFDMVTLEDI